MLAEQVWDECDCCVQLHAVMRSAGIEWEEATLRGKAMSLLMEWDASRPHTEVRNSG